MSHRILSNPMIEQAALEAQNHKPSPQQYDSDDYQFRCPRIDHEIRRSYALGRELIAYSV
jgi:hypothetical protein